MSAAKAERERSECADGGVMGVVIVVVHIARSEFQETTSKAVAGDADML